MDGTVVATTSAYLAACFVLGSIPFALVLARRRGVDLAAEGSGNLGAGNASRVLGPAAGVAVAMLDGLKGVIAVLAGRRFGFVDGVVALGGLAAVAGSDWSLFLGHRAGRGLAASAGALVAFDPVMIVWPALWAVAGWRIGGGIAGFVGWGFLWATALVLGRPTPTIVFAFGLGLLMVIRRAQGNLDDPPQHRWHRIVYDTGPIDAEPPA